MIRPMENAAFLNRTLRGLIWTGLFLVTSTPAMGGPKQPRLPALPSALRSAPANTLTQAKLGTYLSTLADSDNLFKSGDSQAALERLRAADQLRNDLIADVTADASGIRQRTAAACWMLSKPACVVDNLSGTRDPDLQQAMDSVRDQEATFHVAMADSLLRKGNGYMAGCHAMAAVQFERTPETEAALTRTHSNPPSNISVDYALYEKACTNLLSEKIPQPTAATTPYFGLTIQADSLARSRNWKKNLAVLVNASDGARKAAGFLHADAMTSLVAEGDAAMLVKDYEEALGLLEDWMRQAGETAESAQTDVSKLAERGSRVKASIIALHAALALKNYKLGAADMEAQRWENGIEHFRSSDRYLRLPENQLGIGRANLKLSINPGPLELLGPSHLEAASAAFHEYLTRWPDAPDRQAVQQLTAAIDGEIARRRSGGEITEEVGLLMASAVMRATGDMQHSYDEYLNSQHMDVWAGFANYVQFGGGMPTTVVLGGQPVPLDDLANRSPAGFPPSDTMIQVVGELANEDAPPLPVMPNWPGLGGSAAPPVVLGGAGGSVRPGGSANRSPGSTPGSVPPSRFNRPSISGVQLEPGCIDLLNVESQKLELAGATKKLLAWTPLITLAGESNAVHAALFINNTDWDLLAQSLKAVNNIVLFSLANDARIHANSPAHFGNPKAKEFWNAMADFYVSLAEDLH